jgi:glycine oxidase
LAAGVQQVTGIVTAAGEGQVAVVMPGEPGKWPARDNPAGGLARVFTAHHIVIAAGHATRQLKGVPDSVRRAIRPVKGQILRLRHPDNVPPVLTHTVRAIVQGHDLYLVPRQDGELVVGATQEERDDRDVMAGAVHDLLRDAQIAVPAVSELLFAEANAGLRPGTSDNGPILGPAEAGDGSLIIAAGHFRNGIMLSAVTADAVTALLRGDKPHEAWTPFSPGRFAATRVQEDVK